MISGGDKRDRTADLLRARQALSQLSYIPILSFPVSLPIIPTLASLTLRVVGLSGLEPPTSPLSGVRSNHLSYRPKGNAVIVYTVLIFMLPFVYNVQPICVGTHLLSSR